MIDGNFGNRKDYYIEIRRKKMDRGFWWYHNGHLDYVIADWKEARQYHLRCHCESCGAVWAKRGRYPGWCPNCGSDAANWLSDDWNDLDDPWMGDGDIPPEDIEDCRITNY